MEILDLLETCARESESGRNFAMTPHVCREAAAVITELARGVEVPPAVVIVDTPIACPIVPLSTYGAIDMGYAVVCEPAYREQIEDAVFEPVVS